MLFSLKAFRARCGTVVAVFALCAGMSAAQMPTSAAARATTATTAIVLVHGASDTGQNCATYYLHDTFTQPAHG